MKKNRIVRLGMLLTLLYLISVGNGSRKQIARELASTESKSIYSRKNIAQMIGMYGLFPDLPQSADISLNRNDKEKTHARFTYTLNSKLQKTMESLFQLYHPDYGAFVALDPKTGKVLAIVSYSHNHHLAGNISPNVPRLTSDQEPGGTGSLALRASYPSASIFKVVTAAAAIESHKISAETVLPYNGRNHTLYRNQILKSPITRWTRFITFKEAFARSINTIFGRIGAYTIGPQELREYADRFGFNRKIATDLPVQEGRAWIPTDPWGLAESASGFTRDNTMSPLQGAMIAASVVNDGVMMDPYIVQSIYRDDTGDGNSRESPENQESNSTLLYDAEPQVGKVTMDPSTAQEVRTLMRETVLRGTSRGSFRGFFRKELSVVEAGGKTGSLTGTEPPGKYDWFIGYGNFQSNNIAIAVLTIHEKQWRVKSSYLGRVALETFFRDQFHSQSAVKTVVANIGAK